MKEEITSKKNQTIQSQKKIALKWRARDLRFFILLIFNRFLSAD